MATIDEVNQRVIDLRAEVDAIRMIVTNIQDVLNFHRSRFEDVWTDRQTAHNLDVFLAWSIGNNIAGGSFGPPTNDPMYKYLVETLRALTGATEVEW